MGSSIMCGSCLNEGPPELQMMCISTGFLRGLKLTRTGRQGAGRCDGQVHRRTVARVSGAWSGNLERRLLQVLHLLTFRPSIALVARHAHAQIPLTTALELQNGDG